MKESSALGITSFILALVALIGPMLHWIFIASLALSTAPTTHESFGAGVTGLLLTIVAEWALLSTAGLASLVVGIIATVKGGNNRKWAFLAFGVNLLIIIAVIAQNIYWSVISS